MSGLLPVDVKRCQGMKPTSLVLDRGGKAQLARCSSVPQYVAIQIELGKDGERGAQSCCEECLIRLHDEHPGFAFQVTMKEWNEMKLDEKSGRDARFNDVLRFRDAMKNRREQ